MALSAELATLLRAGTAAHPNRSAFRQEGVTVSYGAFHQNVETLACRLVAHGIGPGDRVAIHIGKPAAHWALVLAAMRVGAVTVSLTSRCRDEIAALPALSALLCAPGQAALDGGPSRVIEVDSGWLAQPPPAVELPQPDAAADTVGRICFTSGTSGAPKAILLDAATLAHRLSGTAGRSRIGAGTVLWCGLGLDTAYGFTATLATWLAGGELLFATTREDVLGGGVNLAIASPAALHALRPPPGQGAREGRTRGFDTALVAGGRLSTALRDALLRELCAEVLVAYGSAEAGGITLGDARDLDRHPGMVGAVFPDVEVEIVDGANAPLASDTPGRLRVRTRNAATCYLNDPDASAQHFADGWFYPGDIATLSRERVLTVLGRPSQVLNIGGEKLSAEDIDAAVSRLRGVEDACTLALPWNDGVRLAIAIAGAADAVSSLAPSIRQALPELPPFSVVPVSAVPRNTMGKVNREEFALLIAARLRDPASAQPADGFMLLRKP